MRMYKYFFYDYFNHKVGYSSVDNLKHLSNNLEVTTRGSAIGRKYSPFNMTIDGYNLESFYHSCKVVTDGYTKYKQSILASLPPKEAKQYNKSNASKMKLDLIGFSYDNRFWGLKYKGAFYAYIYMKSFLEMQLPIEELLTYNTYSDLFNNVDTLSGQAVSCAFIVCAYYWVQNGIISSLDYLLSNPDIFTAYFKYAISPTQIFTGYYGYKYKFKPTEKLVSISRTEPYYVPRKHQNFVPDDVVLDTYKKSSKSQEAIDEYTLFYNSSLRRTELTPIENNSILLCWERPEKFCHRQLLCEWFNTYTNYKCKEFSY